MRAKQAPCRSPPGRLSGFSYTPTYGSTALTLNVAIAGAVTYTWTGSGGNSGWNTPGNWDQGSNYPGYLPTTDIAYFNLNNTATPTVSVNSPTTIASLTLFGGSSSAPGVLTLNGSGTLTVTNALNVLAYQTIQGSGTLSGPVTLAGGTLAGATYSGAVAADSATSTISGGTFNNTLTVLGGATLNVTGTIAPTGVTVNSGGILQGTGTINQAVSLSGTLAGNLTAGGNLTVASTGIVNPGSVATGVGHTAGMLTLGGSSTLTLTSGSTLNFNLGAPRRPEAPTTRSSSAVRSRWAARPSTSTTSAPCRWPAKVTR